MTPPGVTFLDHTADVGMDVDAASLEELLHRAALGMLALLRGEEDSDAVDSDAVGSDAADSDAVGSGDGPDAPPRDPAAPDAGSTDATAFALRAGSPATLLAAWLRELLFLHEVDGRDYVSFTAHALDPEVFEGVVWTRPGGRAVREIKGVTYHELAVEERGGRWRARVIFDV